MSIIKFYNREKEINILKKVDEPYLCIIYGRRRVGKTELILNFLRKNKKEFIYFFVNPKKSEKALIEEFTSILREKNIIKPLETPENWEDFFKLLFENATCPIVFDEFQWFSEINQEVPFILQKYWDIYKKPSIILTGSIVGMIKKLFTESGSPLFKRADILLELKPFSPRVCFHILDDLGIKNIEEKFKFYLLFGGIPYYYRLIGKYHIKSIFDGIDALILEETGPLRNEVEEILKESFKKEYSTYLSILYAIAEGKTKLEEIASYAGIKTTSLMPYLYDLISLLSIIEKQRIGFKKKYIYEIKDFFHIFWLKYVYRYSSEIAWDKEYIVKIIKKDINSFFGRNFERMTRDYFIRKIFKFPKVIKFIGKKKEKEKKEIFDIDIIAFDEKTKEILFCECKWKDKVNANKICKTLWENKEYVQWYNEKRKESFAIFAKSFSKKIEEFEGKKVYCFDLNDLKKICEII